MCQFLSVVVLRNGDLRHHPLLDSHSDLITYFALPDTSVYHQHFAKAELTPPREGTWTDPSTWTWRIDEETRPGWLDDVEGQAEAAARRLVERMVIRDERAILADGVWIVAEGARVRRFLGGRLARIEGGTVEAIEGGTVQAIEGGTVQAIWGGTVQAIEGGTVPSRADINPRWVELGARAKAYYATKDKATERAK